MRLLAATLGLSICASATSAYAQQNLSDHDAIFMAHLEAGDMVAAQAAGAAYYEAAVSKNDDATAGRIAYTMANIASAQRATDEIAPWYDTCAKHYRVLRAAAQEVDCLHKAGVTYTVTLKPGTARERLKSAEMILKDANAADSLAAALVYIDLAQSYIPQQFDVSASADVDRERVLEYTQRARSIFESYNQQTHDLYATILAREATAYEDLEQYEDALAPMEMALDLLRDKSEHAELFQDLRRRYAKISAWENGSDNYITVKLDDKREFLLEITKRRRVLYPRGQSTRAEYGLGTVEVTLAPDGRVATIKVIESQPNSAYGEAVKTAVETWSFIPEDDTPPESIPPFRYSVSFDIVRTR